MSRSWSVLGADALPLSCGVKGGGVAGKVVLSSSAGAPVLAVSSAGAGVVLPPGPSSIYALELSSFCAGAGVTRLLLGSGKLFSS